MSINDEIDPIEKIISDGDNLVGNCLGIGGILSRLFRMMIGRIVPKTSIWTSLVYQYLVNPSHGIPDNRKDRGSNKGNLNKEFGRRKMTWKVLCKGFRILQITDVEFSVRWKRRDCPEWEHLSIPVILEDMPDDEQ